MITRLSTLLTEAVLILGMLATLLYQVIAPALPAIGLTSPAFLTTPVPTVPATLDPTVKVTTSPPPPDLGSGLVLPGAGLEVAPPTGTTITLWNLDTAQKIGVIGPHVLTGLLTIAIMALLLLMVRSVRHGDPFIPANARRLLSIAVLVAVGGEGAALLTIWGRHLVLTDPAVAGYVLPTWQISYVPLLAGLGIAVAAEVFRRGSALRADAVGVV